uniref:Uncharacterized protein n=1 Tax=Megaselia scalaris TaxID=36166 RepID=T1GQW3_MEGSC
MQIKQPQLTLQYPNLSKKLNNFQDTYRTYIQELPLWTENETIINTPAKAIEVTEDVIVNVSPTDPISQDKLVQAKKRHSGAFINSKKDILKRAKEVKLLKKPPPIIVNPVNTPLPKIANMVGQIATESVPPITVCNFAKETLPTLADFHTVNDCLNLGSVIKDKDLLKLILKALKWPYDKHTLNAQIQRLKCTRFRDIMVDPLLLQDTDLIQILTQYFGPNFKFQQPPQKPMESSSRKSPPPLQPILPQSLTYKLPAETSIQVINVPKSTSSQKRRKKHLKTTDVIVLSDDENEGSKKAESMEEKRPRKRKQSLTSLQSKNNIDDLVIMGQIPPNCSKAVPHTVLSKTPQITYKKRPKVKQSEVVLNMNEYDDENPLVIDDSSVDIWENVKIDETAPINQVDHLIGEATKIVEIEIPENEKQFSEIDSTTLVTNLTTSTDISKKLNLPPADVLIKDSLKFDESEGEDVDVLGFELQQTEIDKKLENKIVIEEIKKVQISEESTENLIENGKQNKDKDESEEWQVLPKRRRLLKPEKNKEKELKDPPQKVAEDQLKSRTKDQKKLPEPAPITNSRPARKSKTFSKYYKDPKSVENSTQPTVRTSSRSTKGTSRKK